MIWHDVLSWLAPQPAPVAPVAPPRSWPFDTLTPLKYGAILADPPWSYKMRSAKGHAKSPEAHYRTMTLPEIKALPVNQLARGDTLLFLWSTWPHAKAAIEVMEAWGFEYKTGGAWFKRMSKGGSAFGTGYIFRSACEPYLVGTLGRPEFTARNVRNEIVTEWPDAIESLRREHSRKPPEAREILDRLMPQAFKCELFAREPWPGPNGTMNDVWGNQTDKFEAA